MGRRGGGGGGGDWDDKVMRLGMRSIGTPFGARFGTLRSIVVTLITVGFWDPLLQTRVEASRSGGVKTIRELRYACNVIRVQYLDSAPSIHSFSK